MVWVVSPSLEGAIDLQCSTIERYIIVASHRQPTFSLLGLDDMATDDSTSVAPGNG